MKDAIGGNLPIVANPLRLGRIVHGCDIKGICAPMIVCVVNDPTHISGVVFGSQMFPMNHVPEDKHPEISTRITVPGGRAATWHWPNDCPWTR